MTDRTRHDIVDIVSAVDAAWFREHPGETLRYRELIPGEFGPLNGEVLADITEVQRAHPGVGVIPMVEVRLVAPGIRIRRSYYVLAEVAS